MKFLIIGAGMIGRVHSEALKGLGIPLSVCDYNEAFAKSLMEDTGACSYYLDYKKAIEESGAQVAIVCTPNHLHADPAIYAMERGFDVICEKPMASNYDDAKRIFEAQQRTGRKLMVGYPVRCYPALDYVKNLMSDERLGRIISARCILAAPATLIEARTPYRNSYETGGGIIYDYTHEIDYCRYLLGEPDAVCAFCGSHLNRELTVDDSADMLFHFGNDAVLSLHMDYVQWKGRAGDGRSFELVFEKGMVACDFKTVTISFYDGTVETKDFDFVWAAPFPVQIKKMIDIIEGKEIPYVTAADGMRIIEIADKAYESARSSKFVKL